ncbi:MAG TPA: TIGR00282 family metallophosphoesterase [Patescibacteria group bacterium]|nr:TIGR00282 family metallophosphoesterase [Patescibacteria group bacterium]
MNILYIGDIMGEPGIDVVGQVLPDLKQDKQIDIVIAQAENVSAGKGMTAADMKRLQDVGVDFFTGGNHTPKLDELMPLLEDSNKPVIGPANMPTSAGKGWKYYQSKQGPVLVISLLGETFGHAKVDYDNPLKAIDKILSDNQGKQRVATILNFHGDYSSEKVIMGYYLDGKVTAVIGDHWHTPTADAMVLPGGTAHITDVGMCGVLHSSLGVKLESVIPRWHDGVVNKNELATDKPWQFNAALIESDNQTGLAKAISLIQKQVD